LHENLTSESRNRHTILHWFSQIVDAVNYVHTEFHIVHRDLKVIFIKITNYRCTKRKLAQPSNIFFALSGAVKVGDFGLATSSMMNDDEQSIETSLLPSKTRPHRMTDNVGTRLYMSPEQVLTPLFVVI
jgi:serine/threonine protein kinase